MYATIVYFMSMSHRHTILQVLPRLVSGGVERGTVEITDAIRKAGMKPLVASGGGAMIPHITYNGGEHFMLPLFEKHPYRIWKNAGKLAQLIKLKEVDLIHARSRAPAWSAYLASKRTKIPFVTTFHGVYGLKGPFKRTYNNVMVKGDRVIAVSRFVYDHILREYNMDPTKLRLIPRGVDVTIFDPEKIIPDRIISLSKQWRLPDEPRKIIFVPGRISRIKGLEVVLEALTKLNDIPYLCIMAGSDHGHEDYSAELEQKITAMGLEGKVRLANSTSYMNEAYSLSDVVLIPSIKPESFGRISIEAQAMGKLVIAADHGGVRETIINNETGYLIPVGDAEALAETIRYGLNRTNEMIHAMSVFARKHIQSNFSVLQMKEKTIAVYRELLE
jgi:glycosyltransferase involved in cell wall biosynthesis